MCIVTWTIYVIIEFLLVSIVAGSSGFFTHTLTIDDIWEHMTKRYILHVEATDPSTGESVTLNGLFRVFGHQEKYFCSLNMINTGTEPIAADEQLEFISVGKAENFTCKLDGKSICMSGDTCLCKFDRVLIIAMCIGIT